MESENDSSRVRLFHTDRGGGSSGGISRRRPDRARANGYDTEPGHLYSVDEEYMPASRHRARRVRAFVASSPCKTFTLADASNLSRNWHTRDHSDTTKPPRTVGSCKTQKDWESRRKALNPDNLVRRLIKSFVGDRKAGFQYEIFIENPLASLRQRPFMRGEEFEQLTVRRTVNYCAYGFAYSKATDIRTSLMSWLLVGETGNGRCILGMCGQGVRQMNGRFRHKEVIAGTASRAVKGPNKKK